jgi:hypothetical protein
MQTGQFASAPDAIRLIVSKEGFKGLYVVCNTSNFKIWFSTSKFIMGLPAWDEVLIV